MTSKESKPSAQPHGEGPESLIRELERWKSEVRLRGSTPQAQASRAESWVEAAFSSGLSIASLIEAAQAFVQDYQATVTCDDLTLTPNAEEEPHQTFTWDGEHPPLPSVAHNSSSTQGVAGFPEFSRYEDLGLIGSGGTANVHRVRDQQLGRTLALKILHHSDRVKASRVARFLEEAQATAQLQHPGIVPIYDLGSLADGRIWFTMREVHGSTLGEAISQAHTVGLYDWRANQSDRNLRRFVDILIRICEAVDYAHSRGVVHRDLKPDNIMVGSHGEVLVLDWGLAKIIASPLPQDPNISQRVKTERSAREDYPTLTGSIMGTPAYMSPEQARGEQSQINTLSDQYALGAILYEVLTGSSPYQGRNPHEIIRAVMSGPPISIVERLTSQSIQHSSQRRDESRDAQVVSPSIDLSLQWLIEICERAMARSQADRFPSVRVLIEELSAWLDGVQRRREAFSVLSRALTRAPEATSLRTRAQSLRADATRVLSALEEWRPAEEKREGWALEDRAASLDRQAELLELEGESLLQASLTHAPDLPEAHANLANLYRSQHQANEAARRDVSREELLLRKHTQALPIDHPDVLSHQRYLQGDGALSLETDPPGAEVALYRYQVQNRRLVPVFERSLGVTPLQRVSLEMGSYLCVLRHPQREEVRYPVSIDRGQHWEAIPPNQSDASPIYLPKLGELSSEDRYVPAGWFWSGGDPEALNSLPRRRLWLDAHIFKRFSVTNREYIDFLDDLVKRGDEEDALRYAPRERSGSIGEIGALIYGFDGERFSLKPDEDGDLWEYEWPVLMIEWDAAFAYAQWLSARTGMPWTLPTDFAYEKAARGVDGRLFPWGDHFDSSWACTRHSHPAQPLPPSVLNYPGDESPYLIRGLAGGAFSWCMDSFLKDGEALETAHIPIPNVDYAHGEGSTRVHRGGAWFAASRYARCASRGRLTPQYRDLQVGFRLMRRLDAQLFDDE